MFRSRVLARSAKSGNGDAPPKDDASERYYDYIQGERAVARKLKENLVISDVVSSSKDGQLQWVDLVLAGGGLLGIAHVGFVCILEEAGVRFRGIGGTSAGAINAIILAALRKDDKGKSDPSQESWERTLTILSKADFASFQDGKGVENSSALLELLLGASGSEPPSKFELYTTAAKALWELKGIWQRRGLHPGKKFQDWVEDVLGKNMTAAKLMEGMSLAKAGLEMRKGVQQERAELGVPAEDNPAEIPKAVTQAELKLVASDVVTQTKVVFPEMAGLYYVNPLRQHPSGFVRASMSVPLFFQPYEIAIDDKTKLTTSVQKAWEDTGYPTTAIPNTATFVDGGTLSNFPISLFNVEGVPLLPTVGCQLGDVRAAQQAAGNPIQLFQAMNNTSRHIGDYEYINENKMYKPLVAVADTKGFGWLDFNMPEEDKLRLFRRGARAGVELLSRFQRVEKDTRDDTWSKIKRARAARAGFVPVSASAPARR